MLIFYNNNSHSLHLKELSIAGQVLSVWITSSSQTLQGHNHQGSVLQGSSSVPMANVLPVKQPAIIIWTALMEVMKIQQFVVSELNWFTKIYCPENWFKEHLVIRKSLIIIVPLFIWYLLSERLSLQQGCSTHSLQARSDPWSCVISLWVPHGSCGEPHEPRLCSLDCTCRAAWGLIWSPILTGWRQHRALEPYSSARGQCRTWFGLQTSPTPFIWPARPKVCVPLV